MGISTDRILQRQLIFFSMLLMLFGLFVSRILLSSGLIAFVLLCCAHKNFFQQLHRFLRTPLLVGMSLLLFIPLFSWFWSADKQEWMRWIRVKLPLFFLPLAFAGNWQIRSRQWLLLSFTFMLLVFAGCCWSLWQYLQDIHSVHQEYFQAKVMATPLENDHVRFSLLACIAVIWSAMLFRETANKSRKVVLCFGIIFFIIYLHVLSVRTGLVGLYLLLLGGFIYLLLHVRQKKWLALVASAFVLLPLLSWFFLPTFQNRIRYILYDFSFIKKDIYLPGANDGNRILSLRAGWTILQEHPGGVGSGDVLQKTNEWYQRHAPAVRASDRIYPSSEWLLYGDTAGWAGIMLFTLIMLLPFFEKNRKEKFFWIVLNLVSAFSLLFDVGLETQFGVFIYGFIILSFWKKEKSGEL